MKNRRNVNAPPTADLVQYYIDTAYDNVKLVADNLDVLIPLAEALEAGEFDGLLQAEDIDTLAELNAILTDATLTDIADQATAAQGVLAENSVQLPFASAGEAVDGTDNTHAMTALRVAQAIEAQVDTKQNNYAAVVDPTPTDDINAGYTIGSVWINTVSDEAYRCADAAAGAAIWIKSSLTVDELAVVALTGNSDDLIQGSSKLLLTPAERASLATMQDGATDDQTPAEIEAAYEGIADTNKYTDAEKTKLGTIEGGATADQSAAEIETGYNLQVSAASQAEMEAGVEAAIRRMSPLRVAQAIAALGGGGGGGGGGLIPVFVADNYIASAGEMVFCNSSVKAIQITLPAGVDLDNILVVDDGHNATNNNITILPNGSETVDNDVEFIIDQDEGWCNCAYDIANTNWRTALSGTPDLVNAPIEGPVKTRTVRTLIQTITNTVAGEFDFNNIPAGFDRFILKGNLRGDFATDAQQTHVYFNEDLTDSTYHSQLLTGYNGSGFYTESASPRVGVAPAASSPADAFMQFSLEVEEPSGSKLKIAQSTFGVYRANDAMYTGQHHAASQVTAAITRLRIRTDDHPTKQFFGTLSLYGELDEEIGGGNGFEAINDQAAGAYEFTSGDLSDCVQADNVGDVNYSIPDSLGTKGQSVLSVYNKVGSGNVTIIMAGTDTLDTTDNICGPGKMVSILKVADTVWAVIGGSA